MAIMDRIRNAKKAVYNFTSARKAALMKAIKASAAARKVKSAAGTVKRGVSKAQIKANRVVNRVTGSKTSALKKRQQAKATVKGAVKGAVKSVRSTVGKVEARGGVAAKVIKKAGYSQRTAGKGTKKARGSRVQRGLRKTINRLRKQG
jgi:hypothetical protein